MATLTKIDINYTKNDNQKLFKSLEENPAFGISTPQNYIPLYDRYFSLSSSNFDNITLNNKWQLHSLTAQDTNNSFKCSVKNGGKKETRKTYLKFSPLLDPSKYLLGKYDINDTNLLNLPSFDNSNCHPKINDSNNSAYVDSFFTYLSSKLLHEHEFTHGLDFYGSFLANKQDFRYNITDDIDYLEESNFFRKNDKILYELEDMNLSELANDTRNYKKKLNFMEGGSGHEVDIQLTDICELTDLNMNCAARPTDINKELVIINDIDVIDDDTKIKTKKSSSSSGSSCSSCSSRSSNTTTGTAGEGEAGAGAEAEGKGIGESDEEGSEEEDDDDYEDIESSENSDGESEEDDDDDDIIAKIKNFPVQVIALEQCDHTLDELMAQGTISDEQWESIVLQILFSLITFQNTFSLTHNDLHTNNVMYIETSQAFLYYKLNHIYYKVPTFGKLFKIIDFGRAIYKFRGQLLCSDSYHKDGDAATQYNCEPYFNDKKPRLEPNFSFDLCRLGCALYDYLEDEPKTKIVQIIMEWVKDDKGRNILYKKNGDERYPDFKLYKMIARTVNKHVPINVLNNTYFDKFIIHKKEIKNRFKVMDIDSIPSYVL